eukprot:scaffold65804_cov32-Tisochrysis_lutea.AAC.3
MSVKPNSRASSATTSTLPDRLIISSRGRRESAATARPEKAGVSPTERSRPPEASDHVPSSTYAARASLFVDMHDFGMARSYHIGVV